MVKYILLAVLLSGCAGGGEFIKGMNDEMERQRASEQRWKPSYGLNNRGPYHGQPGGYLGNGCTQWYNSQRQRFEGC